jgi:hypothetical protein
VGALANLISPNRSRLFPIFHVTEKLSAKFAGQLLSAWNAPLAVDGSFSFSRSHSAANFQGLLAALRQAPVPIIPSVGYTDHPAYVQAASSAKDQHGIVVKVGHTHLGSVFGWILQQGWSLAETDLVLDLKHLSSLHLPSLPGYLVGLIQQAAAALASCRSVTLAASAAPKDHGSLTLGANRIPREDWRLWSMVRPSSPIVLHYGDYCTGHPDLTEPPPGSMAKATVSARYTLDGEWLIVKGRATTGPNGRPMIAQYQGHAQVISSDPNFGGGVPTCWADDRIVDAASGLPGLGGRQKWAEIAANRHMSLVLNRLP